MQKQKTLIRNRDWDFLIILDACRFDYFKKVYGDFLEGKLERVLSPATNTNRWLRSTFGEKNFSDVVYVSGQPRINSMDVKVAEGFTPSECFHEVVDVWDWGWDEDVGTVPPEPINQASEEALRKYPDKKFIIHYVQPHTPFLSLGRLDDSLTRREEEIKKEEEPGLITSIKKNIKKILGWAMVEVLGKENYWKIKGYLGYLPENQWAAVYIKYGKEYIKKVYQENLEIVLKYCSSLIENFSGKIIVTADHGDMLGENGIYGHSCDTPEVREVPWLEIES